MKRYWLFAAGRYYPEGGMYDFRGAYDSVEEARQDAASFSVARELDEPWWQVVDTRLGVVVASEIYDYPNGCMKGLP